MVFEKVLSQIVVCPHGKAKPSSSNSSGLKSVFEKFVTDIVWTVGLTVEIKLCFRDGYSVDGRPNRRNKALFS